MISIIQMSELRQSVVGCKILIQSKCPVRNQATSCKCLLRNLIDDCVVPISYHPIYLLLDRYLYSCSSSLFPPHLDVA